jgi:serine/threonine protein kinase
MDRTVNTPDNTKSRYDLREQLGKGSYGAVYRAVEVATSEVVAVKVIPLNVTESDGFAEIQKEIDTLQVRTIHNALCTMATEETHSAVARLIEIYHMIFGLA